jgi:hypothetical protein
MKIIPLLLLVAALAGTASAQASGNVFTQYCSNVNTGGANSVVGITAPWYCNNINAAAERIWGTWEPVAFAAMLLSFSIAAVVVMFGIALRNDRLRTFGVGEFYEASATALIVILFTFVAAVMFGLIPGTFVGAYNPYSISLGYIGNMIGTTSSVITHLFQIGMLELFYPSVQLFFCAPLTDYHCAVSYTIPPYPTITFFEEYSTFWAIFDYFDMLAGGFMALHIEFYTIVFFMYAAIPVFLVPGIIFRALIPTRHLGGMMMATAIGFYFFMPLLFSVAYYFTSQGTLQQLSSMSAALDKYGGCQVTTSSAGVNTETCSGAIQNVISPSHPLTTAVQVGQSALGDYWLSVLFYPALISAMTYAFITQVAEILGGMARTSGRLRAI